METVLSNEITAYENAETVQKLIDITNQTSQI